MMVIDNSMLIQGSPEWFQARCGKITGSRFKDVLAKKDGITRAKYMKDLLMERKTGIVINGYVSPEMEWGIQHEPEARAYYEMVYNCTVEQVGFIDHPLEQYRGYVGVSPDGLVENDGCIEIKCPDTNTHLKTIRTLPSNYVAQVQGILWVTGRDWCDFVSFDPRVVKEPFWSIRVQRDETYIKTLTVAVDVFIQEMVELQKNQVEVDPQLLIDVTEGYSNEKDWQVKLAKEIRGKCLHGYIVAQLGTGMMPESILEPANKADLLELFNFAMIGK